MRLALLLAALASPALALAGDAPALERVTLADGRVLEGVVNEEAKTIQLFNAKTGKPLATLPLKPEDIAKREPLEAPAVAAEDDKPKAKRGADGKWLTNHPAALKLAKELNRPVFAFFTGSDWCPACMNMQKEVLKTAAFRDWASERVVLLELDLPNKEIAKELRAQNQALVQQLGISGYPTVHILDATGKSVGSQVSFFKGGAEVYISEMERRIPALQRK